MQHLMDHDIIHHGEKEGTALASARGNWQTEIDCTFIYRLSNLKKSYSKLYGAFSQCVIRGQSSRMPNCCTVSAKTMAHFPSVQRWKSSCEDNGYTNSKSCCLSRAVILLFEQLTLNAMSAMSVMLTHTKLMRIGWGCNFTRSNTVYICSLKSFQYFSNIFEMLWSIWFVFFRLIADKNSILQLREEHGVAYQRSFPGCQLIDCSFRMQRQSPGVGDWSCAAHCRSMASFSTVRSVLICPFDVWQRHWVCCWWLRAVGGQLGLLKI